MSWRRFQDVLEITKFFLEIKQPAVDANPKGIQQINFTANLERVGDTYTMFILEEVKEAILNCKSVINTKYKILSWFK